MPRFTMVLTKEDTAVAQIGKSQTAVEKLSAALGFYLARKGMAVVSKLILPWLLQDPDCMQALSSEHLIGSLYFR